MVKKFISLVLLLLAAFSTAAELNTLDCGSKDAAACKVEFVKQMDIKLRDFFVSVTQKEVERILKIFELALKELPPNSDSAILLKESIKVLKEGVAKYVVNKDDYEMLRNITSNMERYMHPHIMFAPADQKTIPDLEKALDKYNYTKIMDEFDFTESMATFCKIWQDCYAGLRSTDLKEYPEYNAINNITKELSRHWQNKTQFDKLSREFLVELRKFIKIPCFEILVFGGHKTPADKINDV